MTNTLSFRFSHEKFVQALVLFSKSGMSDLTKMKIHKLLFLADKRHLLRYGRPIVGDVYFALDHGPLASEADDALDAAEDLATSFGEEGEGRVRDHFAGYLTVQPTQQWPVVVATGPENFRVFSRSELRVLYEIVDEFGSLTASQLRKLTHKDPAYVTADRDRPDGGRAAMPYELFFEGTEDKTMLDIAEAEQEHRDMVAALR